MTTPLSLCPGSGQPTRTNGSCDRCGAPNVQGEYKPTEIAENLTDYVGELRDGEFVSPSKFAVIPSLGYYEAKGHEPRVANEPIEAVKQSNMLHLKASMSTTAPALCGREDRGTMFYASVDSLAALTEAEARFKDTDSRLCPKCKERSELSIAFRRADKWIAERRGADPLSGFGRADEWGAHVIELMPEWFQCWMKQSNWHLVGLLQGEEAWFRYVNAFGLTADEWWRQVHTTK